MDLFVSLRADFPDQAARVIFMTGGAFTPAARAFVEGHRCIDKPFHSEALRAVVAQVANSRTPATTVHRDR